MCLNPILEDSLVTTVISSVIGSGFITGVAVGGFIVFLVISELTDVRQRPALALLSRSFAVFMIPLLILFAYIVIMWVARILAD
jgi:hypothetical protein